MTNFAELLRRLADAQVEFVIIGGLAVISHGHARATVDLDICYARTPENIERLVRALAPLTPRLRGAPPDLPFFWDVQTLRNGLNFTLVTTEGEIDVLGEVTGLGGYGEISLRADVLELYGAKVRLLSLADLIRSKAAAGRAKDLIDLEALRAIEKAQTKPQG
jgi:predicted nucleotidyltransferase